MSNHPPKIENPQFSSFTLECDGRLMYELNFFLIGIIKHDTGLTSYKVQEQKQWKV